MRIPINDNFDIALEGNKLIFYESVPVEEYPYTETEDVLWLPVECGDGLIEALQRLIALHKQRRQTESDAERLAQWNEQIKRQLGGAK